jgi:hypothetical protein
MFRFIEVDLLENGKPPTKRLINLDKVVGIQDRDPYPGSRVIYEDDHLDVLDKYEDLKSRIYEEELHAKEFYTMSQESDS